MKKALSVLLLIALLLPLNGQDLKAFSDQFADIAELVTPSVVTITAEKVTKIRNPFGDFDFPFEFFGFDVPPKEREFRSSALGSGVIVEQGYVITNNHVIEDAEEIKIVLHDKREFKASLVGSDSKTDIAILKIDEKNLPEAKLGNSDQLRVGEWVLAIGSPFSTRLGNTVTHGIISGLGRSGMQLTTYENYIQTDASINPGNSGGALVNLDGEVIGINSAILSRSGGSNGIGFAIPINLAKKVMNDIVTQGRVVRAWLGVTIQELTQELSESLGLKDVRGVLISDVMKDSPAESAKLQSGDVVLRVNDQSVSGPSELQLNIASRSPGETVRLDIIRDGKDKTISVKLGEMPEDNTQLAAATGGDIDLGFSVAENNEERASQYGLSSKKGVIISAVEAGSEAQRKGLEVGDRIVEIERKSVESIKDFEKALSEIEKDQVILMLVEVRGGGKRFVTLRAE